MNSPQGGGGLVSFPAHRWHRVRMVENVEECICGTRRRCTGKPGEFSYVQPSGEPTRLAGRCKMQESALIAIAKKSRIDVQEKKSEKT